MDLKLNEIFLEYDKNWQLLYDLFENLPEDKLSWTVSEENRTLKQLLAHIAGIEKCYLEVVKQGAVGWKHCHMEKERSKLSKDELLKLYKDSHEKLEKEIEERDPNEKVDWTQGIFLALTEHLADLNKQSLFHQGQLVVYVRELGHEYFPDSWGVWGY